MGTERLERDRPPQGRSGASPLPEELRSGIESLSGLSLDSVGVHYDSPEPAKVDALAFAQGNDIHVAPGQERHLPHEAWHVVQQAQGRVAPSTKLRRGVALNTDSALEREAEAMGAKASRIRRQATSTPTRALDPMRSSSKVIQRMAVTEGKKSTTVSTLAELNAALKRVGSKATLGTGSFEDGPSSAALDAAIAASSLTVTKATATPDLVRDLTPRLTSKTKPAVGKGGKGGKGGPAPVEPEMPAPDPMATRKAAAAELQPIKPLKQDGVYYGGGDQDLHVHDVGNAVHVKYKKGSRKQIIENNKLRKDALAEVRGFIKGTAREAILNAAIDRALIEYNEALDVY